jgi:hypothetical protein
MAQQTKSLRERNPFTPIDEELHAKADALKPLPGEDSDDYK